MIADTCFIIDLLHGDKGAVKKAEELDKQHGSLSTTAISVFEIWQGITDINNKERLEKINTLLESLGLLTLDKESAKIGGRIHGGLYERGEAIEPEDSMIAGISLKYGKKILTRNVKHFSKIGKIEIETY